MFARKLVRGSVALALALSAGSALAQQPLRGGYRDSVAISGSEQDSGASYRGSMARSNEGSSVSAASSSGYRDKFASRADVGSVH